MNFQLALYMYSTTKQQFSWLFSSQLHKLSTKASVGSGTKDGVDEAMPQNAPFLGELNVMKGQQTNSSCGSPTGLTDASKPLYEKDEWRDDSKLAHSHPARKEIRPNVAKDVGLEWIEQYELGIYLTFTILPNGQRGLKRVRFRYHSICLQC